MGQIWDFSRSVSVYFGSASQNVLKLIFKSPRFVPFGANLTYLEPTLTWWLWDMELRLVNKNSRVRKEAFQIDDRHAVAGCQIDTFFRPDWHKIKQLVGYVYPTWFKLWAKFYCNNVLKSPMFSWSGVNLSIWRQSRNVRFGSKVGVD